MAQRAPLRADSPESGLLLRARAGDERAFGLLVEPYRRGLHVHCYRMLGSLHDAEDLVQETLLRAWRRLDTFEGRASFRGWLYRIATNACLDEVDRRPRRILPPAYAPPADPTAEPAPPLTDAPWLEPYPDALLEPAEALDPAARYDRRETLELAFVAAIQHLPPRQRAVLLLREVLGWSARETAVLLETSVASVNSALQRARRTLERELPPGTRDRGARTGDAAEAALVARYLRAWEEADVDALVALLHEEAELLMPPTPSWYLGRRALAAYFSTLFAGAWGPALRLVPTRANGCPAFAVYARDPGSDVHRAFAVKVLALRGGLVSAITGFAEPSLFAWFGLPEARRF